MHGGGVGVREVDGPAATGAPDGARQAARTPEMPDDAVPLIVNLYPCTIVGCLGRPVADELEGCTDRQACLAVAGHGPRVTAGLERWLARVAARILLGAIVGAATLALGDGSAFVADLAGPAALVALGAKFGRRRPR